MVSIGHKIDKRSAMVIVEPCDWDQALDKSSSMCDNFTARLMLVFSPACHESQ